MSRRILFVSSCLVVAGVFLACDEPITVDGGAQPGGPLDVNASWKQWATNPSDCPAKPPFDQTMCSAHEGDICAYVGKDLDNGQGLYRVAACRLAAGNVRKWDLYMDVTGSTPCLMMTPDAGSSCWGWVGADCMFPPWLVCSCPDPPNDVWQCTDYAKVNVPSTPPPTDVDERKPIDALTDADRQSWCNWFVSVEGAPGAPPPPETPLTPDGYVTNTSTRFGAKFFDNGCIPSIPATYCAGNLSVSSCSAPLSALTDCVLTILGDNWPYVHGCAPYFDRPGCPGTIVAQNAEPLNATPCTIRVK